MTCSETMDRLSAEYDSRLRRCIDQAKLITDDHRERIETLESSSSSSMNAATITLNGTTSETVSDPTSEGQQLYRFVGDSAAVGTHTVNATFYEPAGGSRQSAAASSQVGDSLYCISAQHDNGAGLEYVWVAIDNSGPTGWAFS